ncbi:hypothetical protein ACP70R_015757 [Stipagrostis hirtigluma subsp. patula]
MSRNGRGRKRKATVADELLGDACSSEWLKEAASAMPATGSSISGSNLPSRRTGRQRLIISQDLPCPEIFRANDARRKRKAAIALKSGEVKHRDATSSMLHSQPGRSISESIPSQRIIRQQVIISPDDPQPEALSADEACRKRKAAIAFKSGEEHLPRPGSFFATETRRKRKAAVAFAGGEENSMPLPRGRHRRKESAPERTLRSYVDDGFHMMMLIPEIKSGINDRSQTACQYLESMIVLMLAIDAPSLCYGTIFEPLYLGGPSHSCPHCGARFWSEERVRGQGRTTSPVYNKCCRGGSIVLPSYKAPPEPLLGLLTGRDPALSRHFFDNIRRYNSMFAMTSMGVKVIDSINDGHGPYVFKISGQLCHRIGSLIPRHDAKPEYCQLYIFDTDNEISNRMAVATRARTEFQPNEAIVASLVTMLDTHNQIVQVFRTARDGLSVQSNSPSDQSGDSYSVKLFAVPKQHGNIYSNPVASDVVGLVVNDLGTSDEGRDLIVQDHSSHLQRVKETHCKFMAMQYPLLFPYGEDGFHENLEYIRCGRSQKMKRKNVTMVEYFSYRLHDRTGDFNTPLRCKRLTQAYKVDAYCCVEDERLRHYRKKSFQLKYRSRTYKALVEAVSSGITEASAAGQRIFLPGSCTGSPRYYYQNYQDCVALCRRFGCPDLFITFTCNALWPEIEEALAFIPGQQPSDRPDIVDRVFEMKLKLLVDDIEKYEFFGPILGGLDGQDLTF